MSQILFLIFLPIVAFLYSSVGHGGASAYLALMALLQFVPEHMKPIALLLNILVSLIAFLLFYRKIQMPWKLFLTLCASSIPAAYWGGSLPIEPHWYKWILGLILFIPTWRLLKNHQQAERPIRPFNPYATLGIGAAIGFISGLIGIGGGILLSPVLIFLRWAHLKETACISALFIFVNSVSGLMGQQKSLKTLYDIYQAEWFVWMMILAVLGAISGAYFGANKLNTRMMKIFLAVVLATASIKLLLA